MHNCVASYANLINKDKCAIYSAGNKWYKIYYGIQILKERISFISDNGGL